MHMPSRASVPGEDMCIACTTEDACNFFAITVLALTWESGCVARQIAAVAPTEEKYDGESNGNYSSGYHD